METTATKARALLTEQARLKKKTYRFKYATMANKWEDRRLRYRLLELNSKGNVSRVSMEQRRLRFTDMTRRFFQTFSCALKDMEPKNAGNEPGRALKDKQEDTFDTEINKVSSRDVARDDVLENEQKVSSSDCTEVRYELKDKPGSGRGISPVAEHSATLDKNGGQLTSGADNHDENLHHIRDFIKKQNTSFVTVESDRMKEKFVDAKKNYPTKSLKGPFMTHKVELNDYRVIPSIGEKVKEGGTISSGPACDVSTDKNVFRQRNNMKDSNRDSETKGCSEIVSEKETLAITTNLDKTGKGVYISTSKTKGRLNERMYSQSSIEKTDNTHNAAPETKCQEGGEETGDLNDYDAERQTLPKRECAEDANIAMHNVNKKHVMRRNTIPARPNPGYTRVPPYVEYSILKNRMVVHRDVILPKCLLTTQERDVVRKERYENWFKNIRARHDMYVRKHRGDVSQWLDSL